LPRSAGQNIVQTTFRETTSLSYNDVFVRYWTLSARCVSAQLSTSQSRLSPRTISTVTAATADSRNGAAAPASVAEITAEYWFRPCFVLNKPPCSRQHHCVLYRWRIKVSDWYGNDRWWRWWISVTYDKRQHHARDQSSRTTFVTRSSLKFWQSHVTFHPVHTYKLCPQKTKIILA